MKNYLTIILCAILLSLGYSVSSHAEIAVIVNNDNNNSLDLKNIRKIFLGKTKAFPDGTEAKPLDQPEDSAIKSEFTSKVLRKTAASLNSYWSRMLFSSKGRPPRAMSADNVKKTIASNKNAIGYIDSKDIDSTVKVLLTIP